MSVDRTPSLPAFIPQSASELNETIGAHIEITDLLGHGGMGAVYLGHQVRLGRPVAVKVLMNLEACEGWDFKERFLIEARSMARLDHPGIVKVHDYGETSDGKPYFVMELVDGMDLHSLIHGSDLTETHITSWVPQICQALDYAHRNGLIHRDVKPGNAMITMEGAVKIMDFGLVKVRPGPGRARLTHVEMSVGTPDYLAPEALEPGREIDHRADIYSMGVLLYQMLTGAVPRGAWVAPSQRRSGVDPRYDAVVVKAMQEEPVMRYQRVTELGDEVLEIGKSPRPRTRMLTTGPVPAPRKLLLTGGAHDRAQPPLIVRR